MIQTYYDDATFAPMLNISNNIPLELLQDIKYSYYLNGTSFSDEEVTLHFIETILESIKQELTQYFGVEK